MSKYTDQTNTTTERLRKRITRNKQDYHVTLSLSEPRNKDQAVMDEIKYKMDNGIRYANRHGYSVVWNITEHPPKKLNFNCSGCRKRKSGDYLWVTLNLKSKNGDKSWGGWDEHITKVCSKECGDLMILRLV